MEDDRDNTRTHAVLSSGTMVSHYRIVEKIGAGGMGEVYLAEDTKLDRKVALKFLPSRLCEEEDCRKRFKREAQAAAKLSHPNIVTIHEVGEHQGRPFFVMEHVEGRSLRDVKVEELDLGCIIDIAIQLCDGLQAAHAAGVIHRDLKPSNIIIDTAGRPKLLDFGLATVKGSEQLTKTGSTLGTVGYMSPEQVLGENVDHRSDLFSLGVILYELITMRNPFKRDSEAATLNAVRDHVPEPLTRYKRGVPDLLESISARMLEKKPAHRYQSAAGVLADLKRLEEHPGAKSETKEYQPSIAVLPFANLTADPEQEYFCDGMAEEIINTLTHIEGLRVVARTSCFAFKGKQDDIRDIGRKLNVDHILEGSVRKAGKRVRITGQLIKISDGFHLWSEKYDRELEDIFEIQDEISLSIANSLNARLLGQEKIDTASRHTADLDAYRLYLRGRWLFDQRTAQSIRESIECYERAIEIDPEYALAYAGLAYSYCELPQFSSHPQQDAFAKAREAAQKALEIDDTLSEAHTAMGIVLCEFGWEWSRAEAEFEKATDLNAASTSARFWYSTLLLYVGKLSDAIHQMKIAQELNPLSLAINKYLGLIYLCAGQHEAAEKTLKNTIKMAPTMTYIHAILGLLYLDKNMPAEALSEFQEEEKNAEEVPAMITAWKSIALVALNQTSAAHEILKRILEHHSRNQASAYAVATVYFALKDSDRGFSWIDTAIEERDYWLRYIKIDPTMRVWHNDNRFKQSLSKIKLD